MQDRVKGPAIGLIITGGLGILFSILNLLMRGAMLDVWKRGLPQEQYSDLERWMTANLVVTLAITVVGVAVSAFVLYAGFQLMSLKSRTLVQIASVVAMIPCVSPCCLLGIPIGIWCLVVIGKPEVKDAFTS